MGKGSAPSAPNPWEAAGAQYYYGTKAANYNKGLNATNQVTPWGSTTWSMNPGGMSGGQMGGNAEVNGTPINAGDGSNISNVPGVGYVNTGGFNTNGFGGGTDNPPQYTETQTLSPNEQTLLNQKEGLGIASQRNAGNALGDYFTGAQNNPIPSMGQNEQFGQEAMKHAYGLETATMDPYWQQQQQQMDSSLRNSGAQPGTPAYDNAMRSFQANRTAAYGQAENQAFGQGLAAQGQQLQDVAQARGIPLNEFEALSGGGGGGQVGAPSMGGGGGGGSPSAQVNTPDIMNAFNQQYQGQLNNYNANVASSNATMADITTLIAGLMAA